MKRVSLLGKKVIGQEKAISNGPKTRQMASSWKNENVKEIVYEQVEFALNERLLHEDEDDQNTRFARQDKNK